MEVDRGQNGSISKRKTVSLPLYPPPPHVLSHLIFCPLSRAPHLSRNKNTFSLSLPDAMCYSHVSTRLVRTPFIFMDPLWEFNFSRTNVCACADAISASSEQQALTSSRMDVLMLV